MKGYKRNKYHIPLQKLPITVGKMAGAVDLNSTNGTFRNGMWLEPNASEIIEPGDEIGIGKLKFIYR